jgi:acyl-CoA thioester hydrolase
MQIRVYYEDTDTGGVVYHSNYLNFCERARSEAFFIKGETPVLESGHFVARRVNAEYFKSAKLGDLLDVQTQLVEMKAASFTLRQIIYKEKEKIFELEILLVYIDFEGKVQKLNKEIKEMILSLFDL